MLYSLLLVLFLAQALKLFSRTQNDKKRVENYRNSKDSIKNNHRMIWPGLRIPDFVPKQNPFSKQQAAAAQDQEVWFREKTMSTSLLMATLAFSANNKYRNVADRDAACAGFSKLLLLLCSTLGGVTLQHERFGDDQLMDCQADFSGNMQGSEFLTESLYNQHIKAAWEADCQNSKKNWISSPSGLERIPLSELICFALEGQRKAVLQDELLGRVFNLLSEIAERIDSSCAQLQRETEVLTRQQHVKNKKRNKTYVVSVLVEKVAQKLWDGTATCPLILSATQVARQPSWGS